MTDLIIVYEIGEADLEALETFMSGKQFLMGDQVCNEDASVFAHLCQGKHHDRGPMHVYMEGKSF